MRRILAIAVVGASRRGRAWSSASARRGDDGSGYEVRAIFDNVSGAVEGEDVKVAGANVGSIESLDVTEDKKAAVILQIDGPGFAPFHDDAECTIRPQSLIGEKFVECEPGQRPTSPSSRRSRTASPARASTCCRSSSTHSPVDLDLINDILRLPYRERLALLINEFGTALAGRGAELNEVIHRANPALRETDKVLKILAEPEPHARGPRARLRHGARAARARARAASPTSSSRPNETARGVGRAARPTLARIVRAAAALPARAASRRMRGPGRALGRDDAGDRRPRRRRARPQPLHPRARPVLAAVDPVARQPRRRRSTIGGPALQRARAAAPRTSATSRRTPTR